MKKVVGISIVCFALVAGTFLSAALAAPPSEKKGPMIPAVQHSAPSIKVIEPKAGDAFNVGTTKTITWTYSNLSGTVRLFLYKSGSLVSNSPLVSVSLDSKGKSSVQWPIDPSLPPNQNYTIVVISNENPNVKGVSAPFALLPKAAGGSTGESAGTSTVLLPCPQTVTSSVKIDAWHIKPVPPGFVGAGGGNTEVVFNLKTYGRSSGTQCYCEYKTGDVQLRIYADMTGYVSCNIDDKFRILLYKK